MGRHRKGGKGPARAVKPERRRIIYKLSIEIKYEQNVRPTFCSYFLSMLNLSMILYYMLGQLEAGTGHSPNP
jgi:hypothetical protein